MPRGDCPTGVGNVLGGVPPKHCHGCAKPLPGFRRKWCSDACERAYWRNHAWNNARYEALHRASVHEPLPEDWARYGHTYGKIIWTICDDCGGEAVSPEVNHVEPRVGQGYGVGCWNHQTNLQVLCHPCHVIETTRQRRERLGPPKGPQPSEHQLRLAAEREALVPLWDDVQG